MTDTHAPRGSISEAMAIRPESLAVIRANVENRIEVARTESVSARFTITDNGTAVIPIHGAINQRSSFFSSFFGDTSHEQIQAMLRAADGADDVQRILLDVDSPGGVAVGTSETAQLVREISQRKPVQAFSRGQVASAAYWIASAADRLVVSASTEGGSIGVVLLHVEFSAAEKEAGISVTEITSGRFKRIASAHSPLTPEGRAHLQSLVDSHFAVFQTAVGQNRNLSGDALNEVTQGQIFIGEDIVAAGLADAVGTMSDMLASMEQPVSSTPLEGGPVMATDPITLTTEMVREQHPAVAEALVSAAVTEQTQLREQAVAEAVEAERERIQGIFDMAPEGLAEEAQRMAFTEPCPVAEAAVQFLKAAKETGESLYKAHIEESPDPVAPSQESDASSEDDALMAIIEQAAAQDNVRVGLSDSLDIPPVGSSARMPLHEDRVVQRSAA
jgi:signal peptide peptidase SppA